VSFFAIVIHKDPLDVLVLTDGVLVDFTDGCPKRCPERYSKLIPIPNSDPGIIVSTGLYQLHEAIAEAIRQRGDSFQGIEETMQAIVGIVAETLSSYSWEDWTQEWCKAKYVALQYSGTTLRIGLVEANTQPGRIRIRKPLVPEPITAGVIWWPSGYVPLPGNFACIIQSPHDCPGLPKEFCSMLQHNAGSSLQDCVPALLKGTKNLLSNSMSRCVRVNDAVFYAIASDDFRVQEY